MLSFLVRKQFDVDLAELVKFEAVKWSRVAETEGERASHFGRNVTSETRNMSTHLTLSGGRGKPAVAETFNRTWQFFPRQVAEEKRKAIAAQLILSHVRTFSLMLLRDFSFWNFRFDWRAKTFLRWKVWRDWFGNVICDFCPSCFIWYWL